MVNFVVKLLSPPVPPNYSGPRSHLIDHMPILSAILFGASSIDTVHILALHGVVSKISLLTCGVSYKQFDFKMFFSLPFFLCFRFIWQITCASWSHDPYSFSCYSE